MTPQDNPNITDGRSGKDRRKSRQGRSGERRKGNRGRRKKDSNAITTLIYMCFVALLGLGLFLVFETNLGNHVDWRKMFFLKDKIQQTFKLSNVSLGVSPNVVRKKHPNMNLAILAGGETAATFNYGGAHYTVWFVKINGVNEAYRIRYDQSFATRTEEEILDSIGEKHGKPGTSECLKAGDLARKCHFQWWPSGGIGLNVSTTQTKSATGLTRTDVTMLATDTYLDGKRLRLRSKPALSAPKTLQKKSLEKLPF